MGVVQRLALGAVGIAALVILFVALRQGDEETPPPVATTGISSTTRSAPTTTAAVTTEATRTKPSAPPRPKVAQVRITLSDGQVAGGLKRASVRKSRNVTLIVTSDIADEVHLHGYDISRDVGPGRPARIAFRARLTGRFEIELEDRGLQIGELEVRP